MDSHSAIAYKFCWTVSCGISTLDHWQTMITGLLAVGAAWLAVRAAKGQLQTARQQLEDIRYQAARDRAGKLRGARAALPGVLNSIAAYAEDAALSLYGHWPASDVMYPNDVTYNTEADVRGELPAFPSSTLPTLERLVEYSEDHEISRSIEALLREIQIFESRTRKLRSGDRLRLHQLAEYILEAATIFARTEQLFGYARRQSENIDPKPLWDRVFGTLFLFNIDKNRMIIEIAERQRAAGQAPGEADSTPTE